MPLFLISVIVQDNASRNIESMMDRLTVFLEKMKSWFWEKVIAREMREDTVFNATMMKKSVSLQQCWEQDSPFVQTGMMKVGTTMVFRLKMIFYVNLF
jgi:hypothetical protein